MTDTRPRLFFDLETTTSDPVTARIVQGAFFLIPYNGENATKLVFLCNPGTPIDPGATGAHGISDDDVGHLPSFGDLHDDGPSYAERVQQLVDLNPILVGYNSRRFDTPILHAELQRAGKLGLATDAFGEIDQDEIDLFRCWSELEPRTLTSALTRFGIETEDWGAHDAWEDTRVLRPLMQCLMQRFDQDVDQLLKMSCPADAVDRDGKLKRREDDVVVVAFGKHADKPLGSVPRDYLYWMLDKDFPPSTKACIRRFLGTGTL